MTESKRIPFKLMVIWSVLLVAVIIINQCYNIYILNIENIINLDLSINLIKYIIRITPSYIIWSIILVYITKFSDNETVQDLVDDRFSDIILVMRDNTNMIIKYMKEVLYTNEERPKLKQESKVDKEE